MTNGFRMTALALVVGMAGTSAQAESRIVGFGNLSCSDIETYLHDPLAGQVLAFWAQGYLSGVNVVMAQTSGVERDLEQFSRTDAAVDALKASCSDRSDQRIASHLIKIYGTMPPTGP